MTLNNYQFQFGEDFSFGGAGSPFQIISVDGLAGVPSLRVQDDNRGYNDGALTGRDFYNGRTLVFTIHVFAGDGNSAHQNLQLLQDYLKPQQTGTTSLQFQLSVDDTEKLISGRVRSRTISIDPEYTYGYIRSQVSFFCPDPRYYDNVLQALNLSPTGVINGRTYNRVYDLNFGGGTQANFGTITNSGWMYTSPVATIQGPIIDPIFGCVETGQYVGLNVTLTALDFLVIDLNEKIVTLNGSPARNLVTTDSQWFTVAANSSVTVYLDGTGITAGTTAVTVNWRNAYI
jgi:hypothetical protein